MVFSSVTNITAAMRISVIAEININILHSRFDSLSQLYWRSNFYFSAANFESLQRKQTGKTSVI